MPGRAGPSCPSKPWYRGVGVAAAGAVDVVGGDGRGDGREGRAGGVDAAGGLVEGGDVHAGEGGGRDGGDGGAADDEGVGGVLPAVVAGAGGPGGDDGVLEDVALGGGEPGEELVVEDGDVAVGLHAVDAEDVVGGAGDGVEADDVVGEEDPSVDELGVDVHVVEQEGRRGEQGDGGRDDALLDEVGGLAEVLDLDAMGGVEHLIGVEAGEALADEDVALDEDGASAMDLQRAAGRLEDGVAADAGGGLREVGRAGGVAGEELAPDELEGDAGAMTREAGAGDAAPVVLDLVVLDGDVLAVQDVHAADGVAMVGAVAADQVVVDAQGVGVGEDDPAECSDLAQGRGERALTEMRAVALDDVVVDDEVGGGRSLETLVR